MTAPDVGTDKLPAGYSVHISGSGVNLVLKQHGEVVPGEYCAAACNAREYLARRAWKRHREMERLRQEALRA